MAVCPRIGTNPTATLLSNMRQTPPQPCANIPFSRDPDYVNRGDILDQIDQRFSKPAARVALVGLGGVHASTQARVEEGFRMIANTVKLSGRNQPKANIPQLVYDWLFNERNGRWVMVLDSADDRDVFYDLASGDARDGRQFATYLLQNALKLLEKKLGSLPDIDVATNLVQALDYIPLAISQAAAYIQARAPLSSPEKYLAEFRKSERNKSKLLLHDAGDIRRDGGASNAILTTWQISFDHIGSKRPSAADLLSLMSFFDPQGIPGWVLKPPGIARRKRARDLYEGEDEGGDEGGDEESDHGSSAMDSDVNDDIDDDMDDEFQDDLAMLRHYCLIVINEAGNDFEMHGLIQLATRRWLEVCGKQEAFKQQYIDRISKSFPTGEYENWALCRSLFAHAQVALGYQPSENTVERWATLLYNGGWYAWLQGRYEVAQQMVAKAKRVFEKRLGKEDVSTLNSMSLFAQILSDRGRWDEAEKLDVQVMETSKIKLGADHPNTLTSMANLAFTFWSQGRWDEAEKLDVQVMETSKIKLGADHPDTLTSMANLASTFWKQGRWDEAEKLHVQVMEIRKTKLGADHLDTLSSINNLALIYGKQGRLDEAEKLKVQVIGTSKIKLGADHPNTLTSMANLASIFWKQGRWDEAEKLEVQVMEMSKIKLGADHPDTLISMDNLAITWKSQGRHADALVLMKNCAQSRQRVLGDEHPYTLSSLAMVAKWSN
ncbi:kinesin light chain [Cladorrhinum sp. PSN259]|nr:kinesin light chain [Cladorrhinum sp. PSN259]